MGTERGFYPMRVEFRGGLKSGGGVSWNGIGKLKWRIISDLV